MKKLKLEKLERKHKFFKGFNIFTRTLLYIPVCMLLGWASSFIFDAIWVKILWSICACLSWDSITRFVWSKAQKKAKKIEKEIEEYVETEQGEKEAEVLYAIEAMEEILKEKDCSIKEETKTILQKLIEKKQMMANPPKVKFTDKETGETFEAEIVDDKPIDGFDI